MSIDTPCTWVSPPEMLVSQCLFRVPVGPAPRHLSCPGAMNNDFHLSLPRPPDSRTRGRSRNFKRQNIQGGNVISNKESTSILIHSTIYPKGNGRHISPENRGLYSILERIICFARSSIALYPSEVGQDLSLGLVEQ